MHFPNKTILFFYIHEIQTQDTKRKCVLILQVRDSQMIFRATSCQRIPVETLNPHYLQSLYEMN